MIKVKVEVASNEELVRSGGRLARVIKVLSLLRKERKA